MGIIVKPSRDWLVELDHDQRRRFEAELDRRINYDRLTELPGRQLARQILDEAVLVAQHAGTRVAVVVADLTNFRTINDTLGHAAGDQLLLEAAWRLRACVSDEQPIARVSGDEFCIILPDVNGDADLEALTGKIFDVFDTPFMIQGREVFTNVTVGSAVYPDDADGPEQVLRYADLAMSSVKKPGVNGYCRFTSALGAGIERRSRIAALLRSAFARSEFHLAYQPLVDAQTGAVVAAEALLRWNSQELGVVGPDQFIPVAEENGMIIPIGTWTLEKACNDATDWCRTLGRAISVAVNVSPRQLLAPGFAKLVADVLDRTGLEASLLKIEVTEGSLVADVELCRQVLQDLRALGVVLALDDFGTGYSALSYLQQFEFDILKLDQSFIRKTKPGTPGAALAASIIAMATCLGMKTVGEGVENQGHVDMLQSNGCNLMQGYLFSSPISQQALVSLISGGNGWSMESFSQAA